jgi:hypothetical protein
VSAADSGAAPEPPTGTCTGGNNSGPSGGDSSVAMLDAAGAGPGEQQGRSLPCVVWGTTKLDAFKLCVNRHCGCFQVHQQRVTRMKRVNSKVFRELNSFHFDQLQFRKATRVNDTVRSSANDATSGVDGSSSSLTRSSLVRTRSTLFIEAFMENYSLMLVVAVAYKY